MGVDYTLCRLHRPVGSDGVSLDELESLTAGLTFGPLEDLKRRLLEAKVCGIDLLASDSPGEVVSSESIEETLALAAGGEELVNPFTGEPFRMPKHEHMQIHGEDGRFLDVTFWGDPVERVTFGKPSPRDILPFVDALSDLAPLGIWTVEEGRVVDPERYRPVPPFACSGRVSSPLPLDELPFRERSGPRWAVGVPAFLDARSRAVVSAGRVFMPTHDALVALDAGSGAELWARQWNSGRMRVTAARSAVVVAGDDANVHGLCPETGEVLWSLPINGSVAAAATLIAEDAVAFGTSAGCLYAVECSGGEISWWTDGLPGPLYTRIATSGREVIATSTDYRSGLVVAFDNPPGDRPPAVHAIEGRPVNERTFEIPTMLEVAAVGREVFVMSSHEIVRLSLPDLEERTMVEEYTWDTRFERFMVALDGRRLAYAISTGENEGVLRVIDATFLDRLYEMPLSQPVSEAVVVDRDRFAVVLRPFRGSSGTEGKLLVVDTRSATTVRKVPLGVHGWQAAYVAAAGDALLTATEYRWTQDPAPRTESMLACWEGESMGAA